MPEATTHAAFDAELDDLRARLLAMGGLAESQLAQAVYALVHASGETASRVLQREARVNAAEVEADGALWSLVARRQPTARDLRLLVAVAKSVRELERVGDEAARIARIAHRLLTQGVGGRLREVLKAVDATALMALHELHQALDAFARLDTAQALAVLRADPALDAGFDALLRQLVEVMADDPRTIGAGLELVFVAKALERVGDHAKNVSEQVIYCVAGNDVRHIHPDEAATLVSPPA
jgi:phosphate transport system protein